MVARNRLTHPCALSRNLSPRLEASMLKYKLRFRHQINSVFSESIHIYNEKFRIPPFKRGELIRV